MEFKEKINQNITIVGKISDVIWQHMIAYEPDYPEILYFDPKNGGPQIVLYAKTEIENELNKNLIVSGKVKEIKGNGQKGQKIDDVAYREYHIIVDCYEHVDCMVQKNRSSFGSLKRIRVLLLGGWNKRILSLNYYYNW